ncbi:putative protein kinase RLK-Pelle-CrRLK1L-1 family [Helianthus debilis subsp. tardiflorus]
MSFIEEFDHLKIQLQDIISATENFSTNKLIGRGGFGRVYKGELFLPEGKTMVAFKRLDRRLGQGNVEFWKEIMMLSKYKHEHLVSLMHFCNEGDEMILVYEYASRGSLDRYLGDVNLTWTQRLKICIGVARGLSYLHDPMESQQRVIHRDIKSGNILLDEKWTAKVSDFGLSKTGPANQPQTYLISNVVGTPGYCDPLYWEMGFLSKESDVYSFGVVLFEVLCGRLCCEYRGGELSNILVPKWRRCYEEKRLDEIILVGLKEQMEPGSFNFFSAIAYRCVKKAREERPTIAEIVKQLEFALEQQEIFENLVKRVDIAELIKIADLAVPPLSYGSHNQLLMLLLKGFLVDDGKTWVSINIRGEVTKTVSATKCFFGDNLVTKNAYTAPNRKAKVARCKFPYYVWNVYSNRFRVEVNSHFLTPHVTYTIYIVFKYCGRSSPKYIPFEYKLAEETHYSRSCIAYAEEDDGWLVTKLYQFTSHHGPQHFSIDFLSRNQIPLDHQFGFEEEFAFEGIEFRPLENVTCGNQERKVKVAADLEPNLLMDFKDLIELSKDYIQWTTKKELYFLLRKGFLIDGDTWFSISKNMKKRLMIPASTFLDTIDWKCNSVPESQSRFKVVTKSLKRYSFEIRLRADSKILSPQTKYSCHLIFKLPDTYASFEGPMVIGIDDGYKCHLLPWSICLNTRSHPPTVGSHGDKRSTPGPLQARKMKGHPKQRKDGWMEVQFSEVSVSTTDTVYKLYVEEKRFRSMSFFGIVIEGIEFRPL